MTYEPTKYSYPNPAAKNKIDVELVIPLPSYRKIMAYATLAEGEVTGFADVEYNKETQRLTIGEVYLLEQEGSAAHVHMEEEDVAKFNLEMIRAGKDQLPRLWWHSHADMPVFFSGTDEDTIDQLKNETYLVALVVNKKFEMKAKMVIASEKKLQYKEETTIFGETEIEEKDETTREYIEIDPLPVRIQLEYVSIPKAIQEEVIAKVKKKVITPAYLPEGHHNPFKNVKGTKKNFFAKDDTRTGEKNDEDEDRKLAEYERKYKNARYLPKNPIDAQERITTHNLTKRWDYTLNEYVYVDPKENIWIDYWRSVKQYDNDDTGEEEMTYAGS